MLEFVEFPRSNTASTLLVLIYLHYEHRQHKQGRYLIWAIQFQYIKSTLIIKPLESNGNYMYHLLQ
jgi:hypothetical protein